MRGDFAAGTAWLPTQVIIAPMTSGNGPAPFRIPVRHMRKDGLILLEQIRTMEKVRLVTRIVALAPPVLRATLATLDELFAE